MTEPVRWKEDPTLEPELQEWLAHLPNPTAIPAASLASLEPALADTVSSSPGSSAPKDSPVGIARDSGGAVASEAGASKLGALGGGGFAAVALAVMGTWGGSALRGPSTPAGEGISHVAPPPDAPERESQRMGSPANAPTEAEVAPEIAVSPGRSGKEGIAPSADSRATTRTSDESLTAPKRAPATGAGSLAAEAALLARAQAALAKDPERTLGILEEYETRFPERRLGLEADVLRIEALDAAGHGARARQAARVHLEAHPRSPYGRRVGPLRSNSVKE